MPNGETDLPQEVIDEIQRNHVVENPLIDLPVTPEVDTTESITSLWENDQDNVTTAAVENQFEGINNESWTRSLSNESIEPVGGALNFYSNLLKREKHLEGDRVITLNGRQMYYVEVLVPVTENEAKNLPQHKLMQDTNGRTLHYADVNYEPSEGEVSGTVVQFRVLNPTTGGLKSHVLSEQEMQNEVAQVSAWTGKQGNALLRVGIEPEYTGWTTKTGWYKDESNLQPWEKGGWRNSEVAAEQNQRRFETSLAQQIGDSETSIAPSIGGKGMSPYVAAALRKTLPGGIVAHAEAESRR